MKKITLLSVLFIGTFSPYTAMSKTKIIIKHNNYIIKGSKFNNLKDQIIELGPKAPYGRSFAAHVGYNIKWNYELTQSKHTCIINNADTVVEIKYTAPHWEKPTDISEKIVDRWNKFYKAMTIHEDGHIIRAIAAANEIDAKLNNLPAAANCNEMKEIIDKTANEIAAKYDHDNKHYDVVTSHGLKQGAILPN